MRPAIIWGFGNLGRALVRAIAAGGDFEIVAVIETAPGAAGRTLSELFPEGGIDAPVLARLEDYKDGPATVFHATTSAPGPATEQVLHALGLGHAVVSAAEWLFHPWLRFRNEAAALDAAARKASTWALGVGINPGFAFETLPALLARTVHSVASIDILRVSNVSGVGPADFAHLGFGLSEGAFSDGIARGAIEGHMGFPESIAALAECLGMVIDRITDHLEPTLAERPLQLSHRLVAPGEVVGITQIATGYAGDRALLKMKLEMFLDPAGYGRTPQEAIEIAASRSFRVELKPAAPPVDGAAAMMVRAAAALPAVPPGLVSLLDLPIGGAPADQRLRAAGIARSRAGTEIEIAPAG